MPILRPSRAGEEDGVLLFERTSTSGERIVEVLIEEDEDHLTIEESRLDPASGASTLLRSTRLNR